MVSIAQIELGLTKYIDAEIVPTLPVGGQYDAIKNTAFKTMAAYAIKNGRNALQGVLKHPMLTAIGAVNADGMVDIDGIAGELKKNIPAAGLQVEIPLMGIIMTFHESDIDTLRKYITE